EKPADQGEASVCIIEELEAARRRRPRYRRLIRTAATQSRRQQCSLITNWAGGRFSSEQPALPTELCMRRHVSVQDEPHPFTRGDASMARLAYTSMLIALAVTCASAQAQQQGGGSAAQIMSSVPANSETITHW